MLQFVFADAELPPFPVPSCKRYPARKLSRKTLRRVPNGPTFWEIVGAFRNCAVSRRIRRTRGDATGSVACEGYFTFESRFPGGCSVDRDIYVPSTERERSNARNDRGRAEDARSEIVREEERGRVKNKSAPILERFNFAPGDLSTGSTGIFPSRVVRGVPRGDKFAAIAAFTFNIE